MAVKMRTLSLKIGSSTTNQLSPDHFWRLTFRFSSFLTAHSIFTHLFIPHITQYHIYPKVPRGRLTVLSADRFWKDMDDRTFVSGNGDEEPQFPPLARQGSNYNLTLDCNEVQSNLGNINKPLNTNMAHLDELLKNVISVDQEGQLLQNPSSSPSSSLPTSLFLGNFNLNAPLMSSKKKTMDQVWKEIVHHDHHPLNLNSAAANESLHHQRMTTIGESTSATTPPDHLLVRAGILNAHPMMPIDPTAAVSQQADWFQFQVAAAAQQQMTMLDSNFKVCESVFENSSSAMNLDTYSENHQVGMSIPMPAISAASSSESQATHAQRKHNYSDEMKEKSIERRQKRMIKNRESAARSRARKQAYTNQLESEVFHLRKTNTWLKKQKEVEILLSSNPTNSMPKYQLRRISSASF